MANIIAKRAILPEELRAVGACDVDDLVHDFVRPRLASVNVAYDDWKFFTVEDNTHLTVQQRSAVRAVFNDPSFYHEMKFYPGFENIMRPAEDFGTRIIMATNCPDAESARLKRYHIHQKIVIPDEDILAFVTGPTSEHALRKKPLPPKMLFYADDAIHNLLHSDAKYLISMEKPWNTSPELRKPLAGRQIFWVPNGDFQAINEIIYNLCAEHYKQVTS